MTQRLPPAISPWATRALGAALLYAVALGAAAVHVPYDVDLYDEGLIANGAALALHGQWPAVHYYAPYPPGAFLALAIAFRLWGVRLLVERRFAAALAALIGPLGFWLTTGFTTGRRHGAWRSLALAWLTCLVAALLLSARWVTPVNGGALAQALAAGLALQAALPRARLRRAFFCGIAGGATALWRLDFGAYTLAAGGIVWLFHAGMDGGAADWRRRLAGLAALSLGALAVLGPSLGWLLAAGGQRAAASLFLWPLASTAAARLPWIRHWSAYLVPLVAVLLWSRPPATARREPRRVATGHWLLITGFGFLIYSLGRTHAIHLLPLQLFALLLAALAVGDAGAARGDSPAARLPTTFDGWRWGLVGLMLVGLGVGPVREYFRARCLSTRQSRMLPGARGAGVYASPRQAEAYRRIVTYLRGAVPAGARIYCGASRHDIFLKNDNLAYFLSGRESGTYYWCLDAGVTSLPTVQREMIREMEAAPVEVVLIHAAVNNEPNAAARVGGSPLLDRYLCREYGLVETWGHYRLYRRGRAGLLGRESRGARPARSAARRKATPPRYGMLGSSMAFHSGLSLSPTWFQRSHLACPSQKTAMFPS